MKTYTLRALWTELHDANDDVVSTPQYYPYALSGDVKGDLVVDPVEDIDITVLGTDPAVEVVLYSDSTRSTEVYRVHLRFEAPPASLVRVT